LPLALDVKLSRFEGPRTSRRAAWPPPSGASTPQHRRRGSLREGGGAHSGRPARRRPSMKRAKCNGRNGAALSRTFD